ncbi:MAG: DUF4232 domain-containing protein [Streptosporangiaceae bacterium]|nr:DUF4232 domain-containing protein [Streptosporangiaceae bacterium]MBV9856918.1 DUF4232 domain-containing protein [Streptosporangiaceae bacterium]
MTSLPRTALPPATRRVIAGAAVTCAAAFAAGCASTSSTPSGAASPTTTASSTVAHAAAGGSASAAAGTPSPAGAASGSAGSVGSAGSAGAAGPGPRPCATTSLQVSMGPGQGAAGSTYIALDFKNISGAACTLYGYPGVALAGGSPVRQIGAAATRSRALPPRLVTLAAGAIGNALLKITDARNYPAPDCGPVSSGYIQVYPPNQFSRVYVRFASTACTKQLKILTIGVVQPGTGG